MLKSRSSITSLIVAAAVFLSGIPYHAVSAEGLSQLQTVHAQPGKKLVKNNETRTARISENLDTKSKKKVNVIVQLASEPVVVAERVAAEKGKRVSRAAVESTIAKEHSSLKKAADKANIDLDVDRSFNYLINAMEVTIPANEIPELAKLPNVVSIYENDTYYALPVEKVADSGNSQSSDSRYDANPLKQLGVPEAWEAGLTGKGVKVGVIDTGVDYLHPDLKDAFKGGYDSIDDDDDPYETIPLQKYPTEHGTHVSGTIVGRDANPNSDRTVKGVAYGADLYVYRVLGPSPAGGTGSTAQVIDGIEHAVQDGMDVINLSLGSDADHNPFSPDSIVLNNATLAGVVVSVANGNTGPTGFTSTSPANAQLPISVGAATSFFDTYQADLTANGKSFRLYALGWEQGSTDFGAKLAKQPLEAVFANLGTEDDFAKVDVKGKIAVVSRGMNGLDEKVKNAKRAGAAALIMFNGNAKGEEANLDYKGREDYINTFLGDTEEFLPAFDMKGAEGRQLAKDMLASKTPLSFTFAKQFPYVNRPGDDIAAFSSRGPSLDGNYSIKPDVVAPGTAILSSVPAYGKEDKGASYEKAYARLQGTSMASPHIAGLTALLKEQHPDWTPFDIKAALANTADTLYTADHVRHDVYSQGAGRANIANAMKTPALLQTVEEMEIYNTDHTKKQITYYGDNLSFGLMKAGSKAVTKQLQLKNTSKKSVTYEAEIVMHDAVTPNPADPQDTPDPGNINVSLSKTTIKAAGGDVTGFTIELAPAKTAQEGVYEGEVLLKSKDSAPDLHLPFVVHVGDKPVDTTLGFDNFELSSAILSPNDDGENDTITATVDLQADDINLVALEVYGYDDTYIGTMAEYTDRDAAGEPTWKNLEPGKIEFTDIDSSYVDGSKDSRGREIVKYLPNGDYSLAVVGYHFDPETEKAEDYYVIYKNITVKDTKHQLDKNQLKKDVAKAVANFEPNSVNTKVINDAVLSLPTHLHNLTYAVVSSTAKKYVSNDGILLDLPKKATKVKLKVKISSAYDPSVFDYVMYDVKLPAKDVKQVTEEQNSTEQTDVTEPVANPDELVPMLESEGSSEAGEPVTAQ